MHKNCPYCTKGDGLTDLMIEITTLDISTLYLSRDQTYKGKCVLAFNCHKTEIYELSRDERELYINDIARTAKAIHDVFHPDKINYAIYGDMVSHLHMHIVPKYRNNVSWGMPFDINPDQKTLMSEEEYKNIKMRIENHLTR